VSSWTVCPDQKSNFLLRHMSMKKMAYCLNPAKMHFLHFRKNVNFENHPKWPRSTLPIIFFRKTIFFHMGLRFWNFSANCKHLSKMGLHKSYFPSLKRTRTKNLLAQYYKTHFPLFFSHPGRAGPPGHDNSIRWHSPG
jgi:hypothetical protein